MHLRPKSPRLAMEATVERGVCCNQFLRLLVLTIQPEAFATEDPLDGLNDLELSEVHRNAAELFRALPNSSFFDGSVLCSEQAASFIAYLQRNANDAADLPISSFTASELDHLVLRSWFPVGPSGERIRNRIQQLVHATCILREAVATCYNIPQIERYVCCLEAFTSNDEIDHARLAFGLPLGDDTCTPCTPGESSVLPPPPHLKSSALIDAAVSQLRAMTVETLSSIELSPVVLFATCGAPGGVGRLLPFPLHL